MSTITRRRTGRGRVVPAIVAAGAMAVLLSGCLAGENGDSGDAGGSGGDDGQWSASELTVDWATYNPLSIIVKEQGLIEETLGDSVTVEWVQSAGSNQGNEYLRTGTADVASTAGSAALLNRANGAPIQVVDIYSQPEWSAIVVGPDSDISSPEDLKGKKIAATLGTDPYFFLLQALEEGGLTLDDVEVVNIQHADGRSALDGGSVDAWAGLDPIMGAAEAESGDRLVYRNVDFNTYGFLNATEQIINDHPDVLQVVVDAYEEARAWALENPDETAQLLADAAQIDLDVATTVIQERSNLDVSGVPGQDQLDVLEVVAPVLVDSGDVTGGQEAVDEALKTIVNDTFAKAATSE